MATDYYTILGVQPDAAPEEIRKAYREKVAFYHPDHWQNNPKMRQKAEEHTKEINEAYEILSDTIKRAQYDKERTAQFSWFEKEERRKREEAEDARHREEYERRQRQQAEAERQDAEYERRQTTQSEEAAGHQTSYTRQYRPQGEPRSQGQTRRTITSDSRTTVLLVVGGIALMVVAGANMLIMQTFYYSTLGDTGASVMSFFWLIGLCTSGPFLLIIGVARVLSRR